ncbi:hypothetical protein [Eikenella corrodens]|jgi:hypothetical protein|uniref:hypothetical protein n=1 Tax=Eikenella corrodens TaxID=539 RepID=UPI001F02CFD4|nr:hypothetical protein [Eikenella corrodens]MDU1346844.1 hypothetical protein [Eikenella corrodens]
MTPLHYAMQAKNGDAALALLDAGANPNIPNRDNVIPLGMMGAMPHRLDVLNKDAGKRRGCALPQCK